MIDASGRDIRLEIDGGVNLGNIQEIARAGADMFVAGSALLKAPRTQEGYRETIQGMRRELPAAV
jgi:ribulose-phosphate 3-epimerase